MDTNDAKVQAYMSRLEELGAHEDHISRFFVALDDDELLNIEEQLGEASNGMALREPVLALYNRWKSEMGPAKWAEVVTYNEGLSDADRNWLVSEEMTEVAAEV